MKPVTPRDKTALLIIDVQNDFMEGGALGIANASGILPTVNERIASNDYALCVATQDMHPEDHASFGIWPAHCVRNTPGAELHPRLLADRIHILWRKGTDRLIDSYGAFFDNAGSTTHLADLLKAKGITAVDIVGLATDYCVAATALQAAPLFTTRVLMAGCKGVGIKPDDIPVMLGKMRAAGVEIVEG
jgi:nicotinamidase/pyrazinamidase